MSLCPGCVSVNVNDSDPVLIHQSMMISLSREIQTQNLRFWIGLNFWKYLVSCSLIWSYMICEYVFKNRHLTVFDFLTNLADRLESFSENLDEILSANIDIKALKSQWKWLSSGSWESERVEMLSSLSLDRSSSQVSKSLVSRQISKSYPVESFLFVWHRANEQSSESG
jgi:hypothetical protein